MIDHVAVFASEQAAATALAAFRFGDAWNTSCVLPGISIITAEAVWNTTDPANPVLVTPEQKLPGFWVVVSLPELSADLAGLAGNACRFAANRDTGAIIYKAPDLNLALLATARVSNVFAGSNYQFGS